MRSSVVDSQRPTETRARRGESFSPLQIASSTGTLPKTKKAWLPTPAEGWLPLVLLAVAVYSVVYSLISADWVRHGLVLLCCPLLGLLVGLLVAKTPRVSQSILHLGACLLGHWFSIWLTSVVAFHISWLLLLSSLRVLITSVGTTAAIANSEVVFFFYLSFLSFFLGYFGSWLIYHARLPWLVMFVYCSILLVNLNYVKQDMLYLVTIMLGALLLLIARGQLSNQVAQWARQGMYAERAWLSAIYSRCMRIAVALTLIALVLSWLLPMHAQSDAGTVFWDHMEIAWTNIVNGHVSLQSPGSLFQPYQAPTNFFSDRLTISGSVHLPVGEVLSYNSSIGPSNLEGFTYNHFDGHTWTTTLTAADGQTVNAHIALQPDSDNANNQHIATTVTLWQTPENSKHYIFAPAQPTLFDVATIVYSDGTAAAWTQQSPLVVGEHYRVVSTAPLSDAQSLSGIPLPGSNHDFWLADDLYRKLSSSYSEVPRDLSTRVGAIAHQWTSGATDTYRALKLLELHLSDGHMFSYSLDNQPIPDNVDVVDWLLQTRAGYCTYYASAMTVMARLLGIPTRVVNGFSSGHLDVQHNVWVVDGTDAHSWVQAYLPSHGWISFDPTPGFAPHPATSRPVALPVATKTSTMPPPNQTITPPKQQHNIHSHIDGHTTTAISKNFLGALTLLLLLASLLVLFIAIAIYWWRRLYADSTLVAGMYWRLCRVAGWLGLSPCSSQTPYEYSSILSQYCPQRSAPLWQLTELFTRERWGAPYQAPRPLELETAEKLWPALRSVLVQLALKRIKRLCQWGS
ncbi:MAG: transglutaminase domain-containing protein [Ktedonobacteraceae bacterium]|nr:transglutaminase domain-containing protein [Ktedonobacteraceae bacterium]